MWDKETALQLKHVSLQQREAQRENVGEEGSLTITKLDESTA